MTRVALICVHACPVARLGERDAGGMNVYVRELARELARRGFLVDIFSRRHDPQDPAVLTLAPGLRLVHIPAGPPEASKEELYHHLPAFLEGVRRFVAAEGVRYALLHTHYWLSGRVGMLLAREWGVPHVTTFHTLAEVKLRARVGAREPLPRAVTERLVAAAADAIVVFGRHEQEALARLYRARLERVHIIPAGVDTSLFRPLDRRLARETLGLERHRVILTVGRPDPFKGMELLLQAVAMLEERQDVMAVVVGGDPHRDPEMARLRALAARLGLQGSVRFEGTVPQERLPLYYNAAEVVVVPSYYESFGLVALEAMACGTPVVAARVGGLVSLVREGETGYLVPWHCPEPFALRLEMLLSHRSLRASMGHAARRFALTMSWDRVAERMVSLYQALFAPSYSWNSHLP